MIVAKPRHSGQTILVNFSYNTPSPLILQALVPGDEIDRAEVLITTPFNGGSPTIQFGTSSSPGSILSTSDIVPGVAGQYENLRLNLFSVSDVLLLTISPSGSTQGSGTLLYKTRK